MSSWQIVAFVVIALLATEAALLFFSQRTRVIKHELLDGYEKVRMEVETTGWHIIGRFTKRNVFVGWGTVWHDEKSGKRPGTEAEAILTDLWMPLRRNK